MDDNGLMVCITERLLIPSDAKMEKQIFYRFAFVC